ncbi:MAG: cyclic pyranopterin monophosphate synthase MoaC [Phycisphaerae bacterium]|nr:cyclic pyranopterin monophosphate synthase MoaC [Phycisphaerae bacterium]MDW8261824.1 cyclic pyranopterin monophosphate synthase MoaC [Phycisphaerales bacterium]
MPGKAKTLTHLDSAGTARMVDVGLKPVTARRATAEGFLRVQSATIAAIAHRGLPKGDALAAARLAGILAAKRTSELIPLCHPLPIESVDVTIDLPARSAGSIRACDIHIRATVRTTARTGVEMEALTAVAVAALTLYDMCKAVDKTLLIHGIRLLEKRGGSSGDVVAGRFRGPARPTRANRPRRK